MTDRERFIQEMSNYSDLQVHIYDICVSGGIDPRLVSIKPCPGGVTFKFFKNRQAVIDLRGRSYIRCFPKGNDFVELQVTSDEDLIDFVRLATEPLRKNRKPKDLLLVRTSSWDAPKLW